MNKKLRTTSKKERIILAAINLALEECKAELFCFARDCFVDSGERGVTNIQVKNHPNNVYKRGSYYYLTESDNERILAAQSVLTDNDRDIAKAIREYNPQREAVVMVWHEMRYVLKVMTHYSPADSWRLASAVTH